MRFAAILACASLGSVLDVIGADVMPPPRLERIEEGYGYEQWADRSRDGVEFHVLSANAQCLFPPDTNLETTVLSRGPHANICEYRVRCSEKKADGRTMRLRTVMNWPSLRDAREHVLRFLAEISAPFEYVQKKWAEKHPTYGDVAFGDSIWSTGNCVFREDNTKDDSGYTDEIFRFIDSAIRGREGEPVEEGLPVGLTLDSRLVQSDGGWRIVLKGFAEDATVVLSAKHVSFLRKEGFVLAKPKGDIPQTLAVRVRIGTVANGWKNYAVVLERPAQAAAPTPEAKKKE